MKRALPLAAALALAVALFAGIDAAAPKIALVVCAPGFPGNTEQAKPSMEAFAREIESASGTPPGSIEAVYYETEAGGLDRLAQADAAFALVPLPFYLLHARDRSLTPKLQVVEPKGSTQVWSLVAKKGSVASPASLAGWEITGTPGYAPAFVSAVALAGWGPLPAGAKITFTSRALSALRRAAAGEKVAVLLDGEQGEALSSLPFASDLEVVARSKPLPGTILCTAGGRIDAAAAEKILGALLSLHKTPQGAEVLKTLRMSRFERADSAALDALGVIFAEHSKPAR